MADLWVMNSQLWVNSHYRGVVGFEEVEEDGIPGWGTMYALTRALQHELGIATLSDNFGAGTTSAFVTKVGAISSTTRSNLIGILQCALWCKGYSGGQTFGQWSDVIAASVSTVRSQLGLATSSGVDVKLMKSLLTMSAYTKLSGGTDLVRSSQQWLNSIYSNRAPFALLPCDGLYTRDVQQGLMYAIQFELGMSDSVANGNFGPGTRSGLQTTATISTGSADGTKRFVSLFQLALLFNGYQVTRTGVYNAATRTSALDFQRFMELSATGNGDYNTWAALLVSTGNPDRPVTMIDTTTAFTPQFGAEMWAAGYRVVGRYLTVDGKALARGELDVLFSTGFKVVPIFQLYNNESDHFDREKGRLQGTAAAMRARQLGFRSGVVIFFAVDYDAYGSEIDTLLRPFFEGVADGLSVSQTIHYRIGVYATRNVAAQLVRLSVAEAIWVSGMSIAYSGNLGYPMPQGWWYNQIQEITSINIDRNAVSSSAEPASRNDVMRTPDQTPASRTLHWNLVRQEVLAEQAISHHAAVPSSVASTFVVFYLMRTKYAYGPFLAYVPYPYIGLPAASAEAHALAFGEYFQNAGEPAEIVAEYEGDLEHLGVVAQGVNYWGHHAGEGTIAMGDLGGWALDVVQLWANYRKFGANTTISAFVAANLAAGSDATSNWQLPDLISDADGWLVGRDMAAGKSFSDSAGTWFAAYPQWRTRVELFVKARFQQPGKTLNASIQQNIRSMYANSWPWPAYPRSEFQENQGDPTPAQLTEFVRACSETLLIRAGLNAQS